MGQLGQQSSRVADGPCMQEVAVGSRIRPMCKEQPSSAEHVVNGEIGDSLT